MTRATDRFIHEIQQSHRVVTYVDVISPTREVRRLRVIDGSVNVDRTGQFRRSGNVSCIDPFGTFIPDGNQGILTPFGTEVRPYRGVRYADGTEEVYPLGVFRISDGTFTESSSASGNSGVRIQLNFFDRSREVSRDAFTNTYTIPIGTNLLDAIKLILQRTFSDLQYDAVSTSLTTSAVKIFKAKDDPWKAVTELATSMGCEIYFDVEGWVVIAPPTDVDAMPSPDFTYVEGQRNMLIDIKASYADEPGFNGIIVEGESPADEQPPVRAEAWDMEPSSATYRYSAYGEVPDFAQDTNVKTVADAQKMADSLLKSRIGFASKLSVSSWTNPALEAGDVVLVKREKMHINGLYVVDAFNIPFAKDGTQALVLRQKRLVS